MKRRVALLAVFSAAVFGVAAWAQGPVEQRQELMKDNGRSVGPLVRVLRGAAPYDAAAAQGAMEKVAANAAKIVELFPPGSAGGKALPAIWENLDDFKAKAMDLEAKAKAAAAAAPNGLDALKAAFGAVGQACNSCHEKYQKPG